MFLRIFVLDSLCEPINNSRRCNVGRLKPRVLRVLRMLTLHRLLLIVRYEENVKLVANNDSDENKEEPKTSKKIF